MENERNVDRQIELAKNELEAMIDLHPTIMLLLTAEGNIVRANRPTLEFLGHPTFQEVLNRHIDDVFNMRVDRFFERLLNTSSHVPVEMSVPDPADSAHTIPMEFISIRRSERGEYVVVLARDIRDEQVGRQELEHKHKNEMAQAVVGGLMHKLNQPLTVITVRAQLLRMAIDRHQLSPTEIKEGLDEIMNLTGSIGTTLDAMQSPRTLQTEEYTPGVQILNVDHASSLTRTTMDGPAMMRLLLEALDAHVPDMVYHSTRTAEGARWLAEKLGLDQRTVDVIERAALFHDIGKLLIPDWILLKKGKLTSEERAIIHRHPNYGFRLMAAFPDLAEEAAIVHAHHERVDGAGYPRGLKGDKIPYGARVIALTELFEIMYFGRSYRYATSTADILEEIRASMGTQIDAELAEFLFEHYQELEGLFSRYLKERSLGEELADDEEI